MLKCENLPSTNSIISGAQWNFSKTSTPPGCARFTENLSELTKTWSSGTTECGVWIGNCNVKVWKSTEHKLRNIWRSVKFQQNEHTPGEGAEVILHSSKLKALSPDQIFISGGRGGSHAWAESGKNELKIFTAWLALASEIVSYTLRVWGLMSMGKWVLETTRPYLYHVQIPEDQFFWPQFPWHDPFQMRFYLEVLNIPDLTINSSWCTMMHNGLLSVATK